VPLAGGRPVWLASQATSVAEMHARNQLFRHAGVGKNVGPAEACIVQVAHQELDRVRDGFVIVSAFVAHFTSCFSPQLPGHFIQ